MTTARPPSRTHRHVHRRPGGVCTTALCRRLSTIWRRRAASPDTRTAPDTTSEIRWSPPAARAASTASCIDAPEVHRELLEGSTLIETGQEEEVVDEQAHPRGLTLDALGGPAPVVLVVERTLAQELGVPSDRGQRGPQLVRGVGHEAPQAGLRRRALAESRLDLAQHAVEGGPEPPDLAAVVRRGGSVGSGRRRRWPRRSRSCRRGGACPKRTIHSASSSKASDHDDRHDQLDVGQRRQGLCRWDRGRWR